MTGPHQQSDGAGPLPTATAPSTGQVAGLVEVPAARERRATRIRLIRVAVVAAVALSALVGIAVIVTRHPNSNSPTRRALNGIPSIPALNGSPTRLATTAQGLIVAGTATGGAGSGLVWFLDRRRITSANH